MKSSETEKICLCIDTSTKTASAAVGKSSDGVNVEILCSALINDGLTHSEKLVPLIDKCLTECGIQMDDIDIFGCVNGPGSFTGLRIGISTINALAQSRGKEIVGVDALEDLAFSLREFKGLIVPMIDARRDNVYCAKFESGSELFRMSKDKAMDVEELLGEIKDYKGDILFVGDGAQKARGRAISLFQDKARFADGDDNFVNALSGVKIALRDYLASNNICTVLMPNYVKDTSAKTQAEREALKQK